MAASRRLEGYASVSDQPTKIVEKVDGEIVVFYEAIQPGAFRFALSDSKGPSTVFLRDHNSSLILGRRNRNLTVREDDHGLKFYLDVPETALGDETFELVDREILLGCSFKFTVGRESWHEPDPNKPPLRVVEMVGGLFDVSVCTSPPETTSVTVGRGPAPHLEQWPTRRFNPLTTLHCKLTGKPPRSEPPRSRLDGGSAHPPTPSKLPGLARRGCDHPL